MTSDNISINSDTLDITKEGRMTLKSLPTDISKESASITIVSPNDINNYVTFNSGRLSAYSNGKARTQFFYSAGTLGLFSSSSGHTVHAGGISSYYSSSDSNNATIQISGDDGKIECTQLTQTSLESIKKNIEKTNVNALELIKNSDVYEYNLKTEEDTDKKHIGFVIGDKYNTPKEVIANSGEGIDTYSMSSIMWKAIQELTARVEQLEKEVANAKN